MASLLMAHRGGHNYDSYMINTADYHVPTHNSMPHLPNERCYIQLNERSKKSYKPACSIFSVDSLPIRQRLYRKSFEFLSSY